MRTPAKRITPVLNVRIIVNGIIVPSEELNKITISCPDIDRVVNEVYERAREEITNDCK